MVLERRRIETADTAIPGSQQHYHAAGRLGVERAEALIRQMPGRFHAVGDARAVIAMVAQLNQNGLTVAGSGILFASGRSLPNLAATLRSHVLIHTAEGEFFREVLVQTAEHSSLQVTKVREHEVWDIGTTVFRLPSADLQQRIGGLGRSLGPPWRQNEKLASMAAWIALAESK